MAGRFTLRRTLRLWPWLALLVILGLVPGLGGFARRTDNLTAGDLSAEIDSYNFVLTITCATLQKVSRFGDSNEWKVEATGSVRNPNDDSLYPILGSTGKFVVPDRTSGITADADSVVIGDARNRQLVPPGSTSLLMTVEFTLP